VPFADHAKLTPLFNITQKISCTNLVGEQNEMKALPLSSTTLELRRVVYQEASTWGSSIKHII